ncbi:hypothetical protein AtubIFM55763_001928 [Aspergillus tubingensis]|uniref:DUF1917-domain-containing protein n=2 Tax=Aspergillus subgen. Circumdati TaxID=2720871 RepID=A0A124BYU0_ASPNG|nr:hypothetical protein AKAW_02939 [Aspergillus niger]GLA61000.1 hypothetical protein AtubIFM54640_001508 [Aspergillus tubingensis]GLA71488.1 hypothetical protein AtubIFM55763_001928 [Aspergillus tubingensis]GLA87486.1 hypothetical protein AtubIFM56815_001912 [Aspergillus tubingensis]GLA96210.1 hypothetical protein AtubIFM57143_003675 [Aspergillus tubingensis]
MPDLSEESSFYGLYSLPCKRNHTLTNPTGSEEETTRLEEEVSKFNIDNYWTNIHPHEYNTIKQNVLAARGTMSSSSSDASDAPEPMDVTTSHLSSEPPSTPIPTHDFDVPISSTDTTPIRHNRPSPNEPISSFLARLRPSSTLSTSPTGSWIYTTSYSYEQPQADIKKLVAEGTKALHAHEEAIAQVRAEHAKKPKKTQTPAALTRELTKHRVDLEREIFALAKETNVVSGKWLLFVSAEKVDEVWGVVAEATAKGELGFGAKVATAAAADVAGGERGSNKTRLICIYTKDYEDRADVERVLRKMAALELVDLDGRPIYYKCDAYTHLDIKGGNVWGLRASMYSSRDFGKK